MGDVETLHVFDFDGTLVWTPGPEEGRVLYERATGAPFVPKGWWGRRESLSPPVVPSPAPMTLLNTRAARVLSFALRSPVLAAVVLTGRMEKLRSSVERILQDVGLESMCTNERLVLKKGGDDTLSFKTRVIQQYAKEFPRLRHVVVWEDRDDQVVGFQQVLVPSLRELGLNTALIHVKQHDPDRLLLPDGTSLEARDESPSDEHQPDPQQQTCGAPSNPCRASCSASSMPTGETLFSTEIPGLESFSWRRR